MVMIFSSPKALKHLLDRGFVISCRKNRRKGGTNDWVTDKRGGSKITDVQVFELGENITLRNFTPFSGFECAAEWLNEIVRLNGSFPDTYYAYLVITRRKGMNKALMDIASDFLFHQPPRDKR